MIDPQAMSQMLAVLVNRLGGDVTVEARDVNALHDHEIIIEPTTDGLGMRMVVAKRGDGDE